MSNCCESENKRTSTCCNESELEATSKVPGCCDEVTNESDCCNESARAEANDVCSACGNRGKIVGRMTPESLLRPDQIARIGEGTIHFCATPECQTVYYTDDGRVFEKEDLTVRVGLKETEDPVPVCYCFSYTEGMIQEEIEQTGETTIPERIRQEIKEGNCECETMNPQGTCCLGNVMKAVKRVRGRLSDVVV